MHIMFPWKDHVALDMNPVHIVSNSSLKSYPCFVDVCGQCLSNVWVYHNQSLTMGHHCHFAILTASMHFENLPAPVNVGIV